MIKAYDMSISVMVPPPGDSNYPFVMVRTKIHADFPRGRPDDIVKDVWINGKTVMSVTPEICIRSMMESVSNELVEFFEKYIKEEREKA